MDSIFDALGERKRREILAILTAGEQPAGAVVDAMQAFGSISQPAVSQHLKTLREAGLATMRVDGSHRVYAIDPTGVARARAWLSSIDPLIQPGTQPLDALATEVARGQRKRRDAPPSSGSAAEAV